MGTTKQNIVILVSGAHPESEYMIKGGATYIMANNRPTLYVGVTSDLIKRVWEHKNEVTEGFTKKYHLHKLVYFELYDTIEQAIIREKQMKDLNRVAKLAIITKFNPNFTDLYDQILDKPE